MKIQAIKAFVKKWTDESTQEFYDTAMGIVAKLITYSALDLLLNEDVLQATKEEFTERLGERAYTCLIPDEYDPPMHLHRESM